jgi:ABC-type phosphate transport system substrate-binding protein
MGYIFGLIVVTLFFVVLHYFTDLTKLQKITTTAIVLAIILSAIGYNGYNAAQRDKMLQVVTKFQQGKNVHCNGKDINATQYDLSVGTYTFIGRENTTVYGEMISATSCE